MVDIVDPLTRSRMMSGIRGRDTTPELMVRRALFRRGFRFARKKTGLPGSPDLVLPKWRVAVFVHGCFWHWHGCHLSKMPANNRPFWKQKLEGNQDRDIRAEMTLVSMGWRVAIIWECSLRGKVAAGEFDTVVDGLTHWIRHQQRVQAFEASAGGLEASAL